MRSLGVEDLEAYARVAVWEPRGGSGRRGATLGVAYPPRRRDGLQFTDMFEE